MENWLVPYEATVLKPVKRVLILAPHPDDEVFGCGGAAFLHRQQGAEVTVVVVSDGAAYATELERSRIFSIRQAETDQALSVLGIQPAIFWGIPDRAVGASTLLPIRIADLLQAEPFDRIYMPSLHEIHPDHSSCTGAAFAALAQLHHQGFSLPEVLLYEVGMPLMPNYLLDISSAWTFKKQAMQCFASQQVHQNYARHVEGLNTYRTYTLGHEVTHAEAYSVVSVDEMLAFGSSTASLSPPRWPDSVLKAAQVSSESLQTQLVVQNRLISDLHAQWRDERQGLNAQLGESILQNGNLRWQVEHQATELGGLLAQQAELQQATAAQDAVYQALRAEHQALLAEHQALRAEHQALRTDHQALLAEHQTLLASKSWRITKPLRWLMSQLKSVP